MASTFILVHPNVQKPQVVTAEVWNAHKELLRQLYLVQDLPLCRVIQIMATEHNFHMSSFRSRPKQYARSSLTLSSERVLNYRTEKWQWIKYVPKKVMRSACRKSRNDSRHRDFRYEGRLLDLARFESRHEDFDTTSSPTASTPSALAWESASPSAVSNISSNTSTPRPELAAVPSLDEDATTNTPTAAEPASLPVLSLDVAAITPPEDELDDFWLDLDMNIDGSDSSNSIQVQTDPPTADEPLALDAANDTVTEEPFEIPLGIQNLNPSSVNSPTSPNVPWKSGRTLASHYVSAQPFTTDNLDLFSRPIPLDIDGYAPGRLLAHLPMRVEHSLPFRPTRDSRTQTLWICCRCHFMNNSVLCGEYCVECAHVDCAYCHGVVLARMDLKRRECARRGAVCAH